jgi:hypothetical protein
MFFLCCFSAPCVFHLTIFLHLLHLHNRITELFIGSLPIFQSYNLDLSIAQLLVYLLVLLIIQALIYHLFAMITVKVRTMLQNREVLQPISSINENITVVDVVIVVVSSLQEGLLTLL